LGRERCDDIAKWSRRGETWYRNGPGGVCGSTPTRPCSSVERSRRETTISLLQPHPSKTSTSKLGAMGPAHAVPMRSRDHKDGTRRIGHAVEPIQPRLVQAQAGTRDRLGAWASLASALDARRYLRSRVGPQVTWGQTSIRTCRRSGKPKEGCL
jgi:hypothetical protein